MDAEEIRIIGYRWQGPTRLTLPDGRILNTEPSGLLNNSTFDDLPERQKRVCRLYNVKEEGVAGMKILSELELERELGEQEKTDGR